MYIILFQDINECATANGDCSQICVNTNGSYYCMCEPGYWLEPNLKNCSGQCRNKLWKCCSDFKKKYMCNVSDINECADMNGNCSQVCTNTRGSFFCSCNCSYQLGEDDRTCYCKGSSSYMRLSNTFPLSPYHTCPLSPTIPILCLHTIPILSPYYTCPLSPYHTCQDCL